MSRFPYITGIKQSIIDKIQTTSKIEVAGEKPFIQLTNFIDGTQSISYNTYTTFDLKTSVYGDNKTNKRFPPVITELEISAAGSLGSLRKAKVGVRFSSADELDVYKNFFKVGNTQLVSWGWVDKTQTFGGNTLNIAASIVNNIDSYINKTTEYGNSIDFLAGILTNFNMQVNSDASVTVHFELSSPSEIVAYLEKNKSNKRTSVDSTSQEKGMVEVIQSLDLDGYFDTNIIKNYVINLKEDRESTWKTFGETDDIYIQMEFALNSIVNKFRQNIKNDLGLDLVLDIEDSIANCHPNMISASDNVIFPNKTTMGFKDLKDYDGVRVIEVDLNNTQPLGPFNFQRDNVGDIFPHDQSINIAGNYFQPFKAGYIKHIYLRTEFLKEIARGVNTIHSYLEKVVSELNIAGAGLYELVIRESVKPKSGQLIYSIVDLTLEAESIPKIPDLVLFNNNSRLIDISVTADLPKELATIMMVGGEASTTSRDIQVGKKMFQTKIPDPVLSEAKNIKRNLNTDSVTIPSSVKALPANSTGPITSDVGVSAMVGTVGGVENGTTTPKSTNTNYSLLWEGFKAANPTIFDPAKTANNLVSDIQIYLKLPGSNRVKLTASKKYGKAGQSYFAVFNDVSCLKSVYFGEGYKRKDALVPIAVKLTMLGISGITIGQSVYLKPSPVPWLSSNVGYWQVVNVEHTVNDTMWDTIVELKFRVK